MGFQPLLPFSRSAPTTITRILDGVETKVFLDTLTKESFSGTADLTQHPVEDGADITDHIVIKPKGLSISGMITENPLGDQSSIFKSAGVSAGLAAGAKLGSGLGKFAKGVGIGGEVLGGLAGGLVAKSLASAIFGSKERKLGSIAEEFVKMRDSREVVSILTGLKKYESYALSSFTVSRDEKTGRAIKVDLEFKEILRATSRVASISIPKVPGGIPGKNLGKQSATDLDANKDGRGKSLLKTGFASFFGAK